jgi:hypothetical protein
MSTLHDNQIDSGGILHDKPCQIQVKVCFIIHSQQLSVCNSHCTKTIIAPSQWHLFSNKMKPPVFKISGPFLWKVLYRSSLHTGCSLWNCIIAPNPALITLPQQSCHNQTPSQPTDQPPTNSIEQGPSSEAPQHGKKVPEFKELEDFLPHSQQPTTYSYPLPAQSSPCLSNRFPLNCML